MNQTNWGLVIPTIGGCIGLAIGFAMRRKGGAGLVFVGAALILGAGSSLWNDSISDAAHTGTTVLTILLVVVGVAVALKPLVVRR